MNDFRTAHLHATIPVDILEAFRAATFEKHRKAPYGAISRELAEAIKTHTAMLHKHTQNTKLDGNNKKERKTLG